MAIERAASAGAAVRPPPAPAQHAAVASAASAPRTRVITLNHGEHNDSTLYRFEKGVVLQFCPGPSLLGRKVFLYTNYVINDDSEDGSAEFVRSQYYGLEWKRMGDDWDPEEGGSIDGAESLGAGALIDESDMVCEIRLTRSGPFHYYFVYETAECGAGPQGSGWFQVAPTLEAGGCSIPLDGVMCQTVLAKCLGPLPRWLSTLRVAKEAGYNMIHFTPIQELGGSGSSYSLAHQLRLNPRFSGDGRDATFADVENVLANIRNEWKMLSICDIVLNHTANETSWLPEHPEATYNARDCPHLRPAALLDAALARLTHDVARGALAGRGVPPSVNRHEHLEAIRSVLDERLPALRLAELWQCDVTATVAQFTRLARAHVPPPPPPSGAAPQVQGALKLIPDPMRRRFAATVDLELALQLFNVHRAECSDEEARVIRCGESLRLALEELNDSAFCRVQQDLKAAADNCIAGMRYFRLQADGPKISEVSEKQPLVPRYFTWPVGADSLPLQEVEALVYGEEGALVMAHNGWVMNADPLEDFASKEQDGKVYFRRELIAWGDSVKLRFGTRAEDSPFLWALMREYVELTAEIFDGVRLDNCHSTPLHVAEYLLDCARNVKPELYVVGELFTNADHLDNIYVNRLGITSLIREAQSAWDSHEQGRLVHRFGGRAVGAFIRSPRRAATQRIAHAMLLDLTHDNPSPIDKRSVLDLLPTAALVSMACCATGSTRGYDELVPHHIHVVDEERLYCSWEEVSGSEGAGLVGAHTGIIAAKRVLNSLHLELARAGYSEVYVDQMDTDTVAVTRHHPVLRRSVILVARTCFRSPPPGHNPPPPRDLRFEGTLEEIVLEAEMRSVEHKSEGFVRNARYVNGLLSWECAVRRSLPLAQSGLFAGSAREGACTVLRWRALPAGAVVCVRVTPATQAHTALTALHQALQAKEPFGLRAPLAGLDLSDLNTVLYRCDAEEKGAGGGGVYDIPGHGPLVYAGLQGVVSLLATVRAGDDLGHALCENLRAGDWLAEYIWRRLEGEPRLTETAAAFKRALGMLADIPRFLQPAYFDAIVSRLYTAACKAVDARLKPAGGTLAKALALTSVQLVARVKSAPLPPIEGMCNPPSLSAGLPHFATEYMRCWGRDTFISLRGLLILTGRMDDAKAHILGFAACLRHGLIPNLLAGGPHARFNCRDAVWWWLLAIRQYSAIDRSLLEAPVRRLFKEGAVMPLRDVMQEALDMHFQGQVFREQNAGRAIDAHMTDQGFTVQIGVQPDTGFPFGGNDHNAGTWMDKMGSSEKAGNRGKPATPRDGSAVELVGLCYAAVSWLAIEHKAGRYPHPGVTRQHQDGSVTTWTWAQWTERLRKSFERHFWIPSEPSATDDRPDLIHRRAIYKDTVGASRPWADYQLRCNYVIAMVVAPELFDAKHAWLALDAVEKHLLAPLGLKTLDPADWNYRPNYDNANDSEDCSVAHGFNYHQGPEWLWPIGFYLRARLQFAPSGQSAKVTASVLKALGPIAAELRSSPWRGLPELTDAGGAYCSFSCRSQAWSSAVIIEVLDALKDARRAIPLV